MRLISALVITLVSLVLCRASARAEETPDAPDRLPVPRATPQAQAEKKIHDKFRTDYAKKDPSARLALAQSLREEAAKTTEDAPLRFVLLREARERAIDGGDFALALSIIDEMAKTYAIDAEEMKASALSVGVDKSPLPPAALAEAYLKIADDSVAKWNIDLASKAAYLARKVAKHDTGLLARCTEMDHKIIPLKKEMQAVIAAARKVNRNPDDADANLVVGRHLCLHMNRWEQGVKYLARGPAGPVQEAASKDADGPTDAGAMAAAADAWWDAKDAKAGIPEADAHRRAAYWYAKAAPKLSGEKRAEAEKRAAEGGGGASAK